MSKISICLVDDSGEHVVADFSTLYEMVADFSTLYEMGLPVGEEGFSFKFLFDPDNSVHKALHNKKCAGERVLFRIKVDSNAAVDFPCMIIEFRFEFGDNVLAAVKTRKWKHAMLA